MRKRFAIAFIFFCVITHCFSQQIANEKVLNVVVNNTIDDSLTLLETMANDVNGPNEERVASSIFLAQLIEQKGDFLKACQYYTNASAIEGTDTALGQNLLLDAVRCTLSTADVLRGDFLLSTAMANPQNSSIRARANIYAVWSWILKTQSKDELLGPVSALEAYLNLDYMVEFKPTILLLLNYITEDSKWDAQLRKEFPLSPETAIVSDSAKITPSPFWYFDSKY